MVTDEKPQSITIDVPPCCAGCETLDWEWRVERVERNGGVASITFYCDPCLRKRDGNAGEE